jgi:hypothetical protein
MDQMVEKYSEKIEHIKKNPESSKGIEKDI